MMMTNINWGIIGCGDVTEVKSGPAFKQEHSTVVAVMRRNAEKAADYAKRHHIQKWYQDASALILDDDINAIYIATPPLQHHDYAIEALKAGKPVYIEKPVTINTKACKAIIEAQKQYKQKVVVAHYRREVPYFKAIKKLLDEQAIGEVKFVNLQTLQRSGSDMIAASEENWRLNPSISGGGLFHDLAPHAIDLMLYFFGKPTYFNGVSANQSLKSDADDIVCGQIKFENNVIFNGLWCFDVLPEQEKEFCEIIGTRGKITFHIFGNKLSITKNGETIHEEFEHPINIQRPMITKTIAYFRGEEENPCSLEEALLGLEIIERFVRKS